MAFRIAIPGGVLLSTLALLSSCATARNAYESKPESFEPGRAAYPPARFVVISDPHVYDPALGRSDPAFESATAGSRLLNGSGAELFHAAVTAAIEVKPDFVLLPGDLSKEGEIGSLELIARELARLGEAGVRSYVVPGNHDVANPRASRFEGGEAIALPVCSPEDFARIYEDSGYGDALSRDPSSLSYVAQLLPGLRLLALDPFTRRQEPDPKRPEPKSAFEPGTLTWIGEVLYEASAKGEAVIAMMHLSLLEHFEGQERHFPASLPLGREELGALLASRGLRLVFTGHFHIQDIAQNAFPGGELFDIATGSLSSYPLRYRIVEIAGGKTVRIRSEDIARAPSMAEGLEDSAKGLVVSGLSAYLKRKLEAFFVPDAEAESIAGRFADAYLALSSGDESPAAGEDDFPNGIRSFPGQLAAGRYGPLLKSLWRDLPPGDNDVTLDIRR